MIIPDGMTFPAWADQMVITLQKFGDVGVARDVVEWRSWAALAIQLPTIATQAPPDPYSFTSWVDWANVFNQLPALQG